MIDNPLYRFAVYFLILPAFEILLIRSWIKEYMKLKAFRKNRIVVSGRIINFDKGKNSDGQTIYYPIVEYRYNDETLRIKSNLGVYYTDRLNEEVNVIFNSDQPEKAEINEFMPKYFGIIMISIFIFIVPSFYFIELLLKEN